MTERTGTRDGDVSRPDRSRSLRPTRGVPCAVGRALLLSFKASRGGDEVAQVWLEEAERRDEAMERSGDQGIAAEDVFRRLGPPLK